MSGGTVAVISIDQLYEAGLSCEEVEGFRKAIKFPHITDNTRFRPDEALTGARLFRFQRGAAIAIKWRMMLKAEQRSEGLNFARERVAAGSPRSVVQRTGRTDPLTLLHYAIGR